MVVRKLTTSIFLLFQILNFVKCPIFSAPCDTNEYCIEMYNSKYVCGNDNKCRHNDPWQVNAAYIVGFVLIVIISSVANAGGLGGGAVMVPIYMFQFDYVPFESIPQSKATILAGAIMNVALIMNRRRKDDQNKLMIDYGLAATCIPLLQAGTMVGVMLTKIQPPIIVVIFLAFYQVFSSWKMFKKAREETKKENSARSIQEEEKLKEELEEIISKYEESNTKIPTQEEKLKKELEEIISKHEESNKKIPTQEKNEDMSEQELGQNAKLMDQQYRSNLSRISEIPENIIPENDAKNTPVEPEKKRVRFCVQFKGVIVDVLICICAYLIILFIAFLRGGDGVKSVVHIPYCSAGGWGFFFQSQFGCLACSFGSIYRNKGSLLDPNHSYFNLKEKKSEKDTKQDEDTNKLLQNQEDSVEELQLSKEDLDKSIVDDAEYRKKEIWNLVYLLVASYSGGIGAGTLGLGGGMIMNPVFLSMGVPTEIAACVAGFSVLFTASATTSQFIIAGAINFTQTFIFLIFSAIGSLAGNFLILRSVDKYNRPSILIWILFSILVVAALVLPAMGIYKTIMKEHVFQFDSPC